MPQGAKKQIDMSVQVGPLRLANPVLVASGTFGFGEEYTEVVDVSRLGALVTKAVTLEPRAGNPAPRIWETACGMLNAIGLQNPGVEAFVTDILPRIREFGVPIIVNVAGSTVDEYAAVCRRLADAEGIAAVELNVSCPNVERGGIEFGRQPGPLSEVVGAARAACDLPLIVKLSPNVADPVPLAEAALEAGAGAISLINTLLAMAIDPETRQPRLANITGGLSGPAIKPVAVRMVYQVWQALRPPIIGMGGICSAADAVEFMLAGASAVAIGTATFANPRAPVEVLEGLQDYCRRHGIGAVRELTGAVQV